MSDTSMSEAYAEWGAKWFESNDVDPSTADAFVAAWRAALSTGVAAGERETCYGCDSWILNGRCRCGTPGRTMTQMGAFFRDRRAAAGKGLRETAAAVGMTEVALGEIERGVHGRRFNAEQHAAFDNFVGFAAAPVREQEAPGEREIIGGVDVSSLPEASKRELRGWYAERYGHIEKQLEAEHRRRLELQIQGQAARIRELEAGGEPRVQEEGPSAVLDKIRDMCSNAAGDPYELVAKMYLLAARQQDAPRRRRCGQCGIYEIDHQGTWQHRFTPWTVLLSDDEIAPFESLATDHLDNLIECLHDPDEPITLQERRSLFTLLKRFRERLRAGQQDAPSDEREPLPKGVTRVVSYRREFACQCNYMGWEIAEQLTFEGSTFICTKCGFGRPAAPEVARSLPQEGNPK